ncbi:hypothetical protein FHT77_001796 [Rhizobium sp. BK181]|uniref:hypothetical protein n=1 Tax=Rhizobium sp. BK181 TaxID=2587072 RepID=UPI0016183ADF|nr:hypothetical protein [Rhizobium sp. BK181]MBB3315931.1 hypothetical protein [Rhizobium sp. BK181]
MKIYFMNDVVVKRLAKQFKRQVKAWGDDIAYNTALNVVARMFGHDHYSALHATIGLVAAPSDADVDEESQVARFWQYHQVLCEHDFSPTEADEILEALGCAGWWRFTDDGVDELNERSDA